MARLFTSGFEIASNTNGHEWANAAVSSAARTTAVARSGAASGQITGLVSATEAGWGVQIVPTATNGPFYFRFYIRIDVAPDVTTGIAALVSGANVTSTSVNDAQIRLASGATLQLFIANAQVGSDSAALSTGTWYQVGLEVDNSPASGSKIARAYLDGTSFAGTTTATDVGGTISGIALGGNLNNETATTGTWFFDDVAVNDSSGTHQNGLPGPGKVISLLPNGAGDANQWLDTVGSAGTTSNYTLVDENPPNDGTDLVQSNTLNDTDLYAFGDSGIGTADAVAVVHVQLRRRNDVADAVTAVAALVKKTSTGATTVSDSHAFNTTVWRSGGASTFSYQDQSYTGYLDPDGSAWTSATVDALQAGARITAAGTNRIQISTVWMTVEYQPAVAEDVGDTAGLADAVTATVTAVRSVGETAGLADAVTATVTAVRSVSETAGLADAAGAAATRVRSVADLADLDDAAGRLVEAVRSVSDTAGLTDAAAAEVTDTGTALTADVADTLGAVDAPTAQPNPSPGEQVGLTDTVAAALTMPREAADTLGAVDAPTAGLARAQADAAALADTAAAGITAARTVADPADLSDAAQAQLTDIPVDDTAAAADQVGAVDAAVAAYTITRLVADLLDAIDTTSRVYAAGRTAADTLALSDAAGAARTRPSTAGDTAGLADTATAVLEAVTTPARHWITAAAHPGYVTDTT